MTGTLYQQYTTRGERVTKPRGLKVELSINARMAQAFGETREVCDAILNPTVLVHAAIIVQGLQRSADGKHRWQEWIFEPERKDGAG